MSAVAGGAAGAGGGFYEDDDDDDDEDENSGGGGGGGRGRGRGGDAVIEMDLLPPRWVDVSDEVTQQLAEIARKAARLDKMHAKHLLPGFDDEDVRRQEEGEIERLTHEITRGFHACQRAIQRIDAMVREARQQQQRAGGGGSGGGSGVSKAEETMARNIEVALAGRVQEASAAFRKKQSAYLKSAFYPLLPSSLLFFFGDIFSAPSPYPLILAYLFFPFLFFALHWVFFFLSNSLSTANRFFFKKSLLFFSARTLKLGF
jgi:hypothetical protein